MRGALWGSRWGWLGPIWVGSRVRGHPTSTKGAQATCTRQHNIWRLLGFPALPPGSLLCHCPHVLRGAEQCREPVAAWEFWVEQSGHHAPPLPSAGSSFPSTPGAGAWQHRQPAGLLLAGVQHGLRNHQGTAFPPSHWKPKGGRWTGAVQGRLRAATGGRWTVATLGRLRAMTGGRCLSTRMPAASQLFNCFTSASCRSSSASVVQSRTCRVLLPGPLLSVGLVKGGQLGAKILLDSPYLLREKAIFSLLLLAIFYSNLRSQS